MALPRLHAPRRRAGAVLWLLAACSPLAAAAKPLTLDDAIAAAVQHNMDLRAARYAVDQARARVEQAGLRPNPQLELAANSDRPFHNQGAYSASIGVSQALPMGGRLDRQRDLARVDVALAQAQLQQAALKLAGDVAAGLYRVQALDEQIRLRDQLMGYDQQLVSVTHNRFKAAEVSELDVNAARLDLQRLSQERTALQTQRTTLLAQLNQLLGRDAAQPVEVAGAAPEGAPLAGLDALQQAALQARPDLREAELGVDRARADHALARAERREDWTVGVGIEQGRSVVEGAPPQGSDRTVGITLSIPLPLSNRNQGRIAETTSAIDQARARVAALRMGIRNEVAADRVEVQRLQASLDSYAHDMLPLSERNVQLAQKGYRQGLVPIVDVIQAQRQLGELNAAWLDAKDRYRQALARLDTATGAYLEDLKESDQ
jgi:cobalt-zinc-cadmium efflux system outer membrane protein